MSEILLPRERLDRIRLIRSQNVGPVTFRKLLERYQSASSALEALPELAQRGGFRKKLRIGTRETVEREIKAVDALGGRHLIIGDPDYPTALKAIPDAPPVLSALGNTELLNRTTLGIVGARNASTNGRRFAEAIARDLSAAGVLIASGLARGIDTAAHQGALKNGTVAVIAGGVDVVYPKENSGLYDAIRTQGLIVSEMPPGTEPLARHFPSRNRIISGLSLGIVVVEAALRSGSLITARLAGEQGREVFAIPGSPLDPRARGTNELIRNGATLAQSAEEILGDIQNMRNWQLEEPDQSHFENEFSQGADEPLIALSRTKILDCLSPTPVAIDDIVRDTNLPPGIVLTVILELELAGRLERQPGGTVALLM